MPNLARRGLLTLLPSDAEGLNSDKAVRTALGHFYDQIVAGEIQVMPRDLRGDAVIGGSSFAVGEFVIPLASMVGPVLGAAVAGWFAG